MSEKIVSNTYVTIAARDGRVLEVADFSHDSGALVQLWADAGEDSQQISLSLIHICRSCRTLKTAARCKA